MTLGYVTILCVVIGSIVGFVLSFVLVTLLRVTRIEVVRPKEVVMDPNLFTYGLVTGIVIGCILGYRLIKGSWRLK